MSTWDGTLALKLVRRVARQKIGCFANYPDIDVAELTQALLFHVVKSFPNFNPNRSKFSTWVTMVAGRRWIDELAYRSCRAKGQKRYFDLHARAEPKVTNAPPPREKKVRLTGREQVEGELVPGEFNEELPIGAADFEGEVVGGDGQPRLSEWLSQVCRYARRLTIEISRERCTYEPAQRLAVAALARKMKFSTRGMHLLFREDAELCRVIGFKEVPSHRWFADAMSADCTVPENNSRPSSPRPSPVHSE